MAIFPPERSSPTPRLGAVSDPAEQEADAMAGAALGRSARTTSVAVDPVSGRISSSAESAIASVERDPGARLPGDLARNYGLRYGFDFSQVRIHRGAEANRAAQSVGAEAYTLGRDIVLTDPVADVHAPPGASVLAHELAHVVQGARTSGREPVLRRSTTGAAIGGVIGGIVGGVGLGLLGGLAGPALGGTLGALGALGGAALGAWLGDRASSDRRGLMDTADQPEKAAAREIFHASLDLDKVQIQRGSVFSGGNIPRTSGNTINFPDNYFDGATMKLNQHGLVTLIHELVHVWQYQHGGLQYVESSLVPQGVAGSRGLKRDAAYNWRDAIRSGMPWERWNAEQQAGCIGEYYAAQVRLKADNYPAESPERLKDVETMTLAEPYLDPLRRGVGAPGQKPAPAEAGKP